MELIKSVSQFDEIRSMFEDQQSKDVYDAVSLFRFTNKYKYLFDMLVKYHDKINGGAIGFVDVLNRNVPVQNEKIVLWGAATFGLIIGGYLNEMGVEISAICDNDTNKQGMDVNGIIVKSPRDVIDAIGDAVIIVTAIDYWVKVSIKEELTSMGVDKNKIVFALNYYNVQYFEPELFELGEEEIFVDGGSLDCITCVHFRDWVNGKYKKIYTFEPDDKNYIDCKNNIEKFSLKDIELLPYGLWNKKDELHFINARGGSCINENGDVSIKTISIDEVLKGEPATFIKMDIEGAELKALEGAQETIRKYRPKLAISIYHKPEDLIELPLYIKGLNPDYKLYIRHYSSAQFETVLYAI